MTMRYINLYYITLHYLSSSMVYPHSSGCIMVMSHMASTSQNPGVRGCERWETKCLQSG